MMASFSLLSSSVGFFGSPKMTATSVSSFSSTSRKNVDLQKRWVNAQASKISYYRDRDRDRDRDMSTMKKMQVVDRELAASSLGYTYEIGNMVAEAFSKVGRKGAVVTLKGGKHAAKDDSLYLVEGMQLDCAYFLPYFVTNSEEMSFDVENCKLLLVDKIRNAKDLTSVLKEAIKGGYPILIIAGDIQQEALDAFVASRPLGAPKIAVLKTFGFLGSKGNFLDDIAVLTRATVIREEAGLTLENVESEVLGFAAKVVVVVADGGTTIVGDGSTKESLNREAAKIREELVLAMETAFKINGPAESIKEIFQEARLNSEIKCLNQRLMRLSERVVVIEVGAETEKEVEEKKQIFDVALNKIKVLSSDNPNYGYNYGYDDVATKKTVVEECVDKISDIIDAGEPLNPLINVDELLFDIEIFTRNLISYDDIKAERLLDSINSVDDLVRCILSDKGLI